MRRVPYVPSHAVGSIQKNTQPMWVLSREGDATRIVNKTITFVPGLYKIFDEILVNAADNFSRDPKGMTQLSVTLDAERNTISVQNNGSYKAPASFHGAHRRAHTHSHVRTCTHATVSELAGQGVPIVIHKEHGVYVPELIFGHLLTSSNYDDDEKKGTFPTGCGAPPRRCAVRARSD
ncbi:hypothetical protein EON67_04265, partial [archaeon]